MKTRFPSMFGLLAVFMLVASLVVPANVANPAPVQADPDVLRWSILDTPDSVPPPDLLKELASQANALNAAGLGPARLGSEVVKVVVASDGRTMYGLVNAPGFQMRLQIAPPAAAIAAGTTATLPAWSWPVGWDVDGPVLVKSTTGGWIWDAGCLQNLFNAGAMGPVWDVAVAPEDPNFLAVVTTANSTDDDVQYPGEVWVSDDAGTTWDSTFIENMIDQTLGGSTAADPLVYISCIDISPDYGGKFDLAVGTRDGLADPLNKVWTLPVPGFGNWSDQSNPATGNLADDWTNGDVFDIKFSPGYVGDSTLVIAASDNGSGTESGCFINTAVRDLDQNTSDWGTPVWVSDPTTATTVSATANLTVGMMLQLPSDFSGQAASLRRFYVSIDDAGRAATESGIYRIDDTTVYELMDTTGSTATGKRISSIAYYGTYASGKLLAGEVRGDPCWATVPTWFTDSPTTCPIPCWYPAKKPTTGSAAVAHCGTTADPGWGNAWVVWSPDGATAYVGTGSYQPGVYVQLPAPTIYAAMRWPAGLLLVLPLDESAFALSRNNGETWNQLSLIDTKIDKLTDVAPAADCTTVYVASTNTGADNSICDGFDSVWRTTSNPAVASPLPPLPIGNVWERVYCRPTQVNCTDAQSNYAILRLAPDKEDGQIVFWGAGGAEGGGTIVGLTAAQLGGNTQAVAWTPDYGDYWANINPRLEVQDMSAESSTTLYILDVDALVQRMPYTGTAWSSAIANGNSGLSDAHTIDSMAEGHVLVGAQDTGNFEASYSADSAANFSKSVGKFTPTLANNHVEFDTNFTDNGIFFMGDDNNQAAVAGTIYRNTIPFGEFDNMLDATGTAYHQLGYFGLAVAYTGDGLYGAHAGSAGDDAVAAAGNEAVAARATSNVTVTAAVVLTITATNAAEAAANTMLTIPAAGLPTGSFTTCNGTLCDITAITQAGGSGVGAVDIVGCGTGTVFGTFDLASEAFIDGATTCTDAEDVVAGDIACGVERTIFRYWPIPKPHVYWDCMNVGTDNWDTINPCFTLEPSSLKHCGCLTMDTDTELFAIDNAAYTGKTRTTGMLWVYTDCLAKVGPTLITEDGLLVGCDPVSGRNQEINFQWEQLCLGVGYDVEIAKDEAFTMKVVDYIATSAQATLGTVLLTDSPTSPAWLVPVDAQQTSWVAGARPRMMSELECGHKYYWKVKVRADANGGFVRSPWSEVRSFTIKAGLPVTTPYYGPQLLSPNNGCIGCAVSPASFSWSPFKGSTSYKFQLAKDAAMTDIIAEDTTGASTGFEYAGTLDYSTNYFWRVMAVEPAPSDWSATFSFQTGAAPSAPAEAPEAPATPLWVWVVIALGAILVIVTLVLIFKTRRV